jgi:hypothetical protein
VNGHAVPDPPYERLAELLVEDIDYDRLAEKVAKKLHALQRGLAQASASEPGRLVTAGELARLVGMSPRWVYDHKDELGVIRAGNGKRSRLRFDPDRALALLASREGREAPELSSPRPARRPLPTAVGLLPVKDRAA